MPEGVECLLSAIGLHKKLEGKTLVGFQINEKSRYAKKGGVIPGGDLLKGAMKIVSVSSRGKKLIFCIRREDGVHVYLISFLGMSGRWQYTPGDHSGFCLEIGEFKEMKQAKVKSVTERVYYEDQRRFGTLQVISTRTEYNKIFSKVGPDLLQDEVTLEEYTTIIRNKRIQHWDITKFIMTQEKLSGCGNYIKAEVLYACRIKPSRKLSELSDADVKALFENSVRILRESFECGGLTIANYRDPDGTVGTYETKVYKKLKDPLGDDVVTGEFGDGRTTHWSPAVQV